MLSPTRLTRQTLPLAAACLAALAMSTPAALAQQPNTADDDRPDFEEQDRRQAEENQRDRAEGRDRDARRGDQKAGLGVAVMNTQRGVRVGRVAQGSPADEAGLREGDTILSVDGQQVRNGEQLVRIISQEEPGSQVRLTVLREGQEETLTAQLEGRREALGRSDRERRFGPQREMRDERTVRAPRMRDSDRRFAQHASTPWGEDHVLRHIRALEQQLDHIQHEIEDLKAMLDANPTDRGFDELPPRLSDTREDRR